MNLSKMILVLIGVLLLVGCTAEHMMEEKPQVVAPVPQEQVAIVKKVLVGPEKIVEEIVAEDVVEEKSVALPDVVWRNTGLKDINSGRRFRLNDFAGKTVVLESFAVWCPTCTRQQHAIKELPDEEGVVHVSLDTDPNENEETVREHTARYEFDWLYAIAPASVSKSLIDEFGVGIVNAPAAPVVIICGDGQATLLQRGLKSASELQDAITACSP